NPFDFEIDPSYPMVQVCLTPKPGRARSARSIWGHVGRIWDTAHPPTVADLQRPEQLAARDVARATSNCESILGDMPMFPRLAEDEPRSRQRHAENPLNPVLKRRAHFSCFDPRMVWTDTGAKSDAGIDPRPVDYPVRCERPKWLIDGEYGN